MPRIWPTGFWHASRVAEPYLQSPPFWLGAVLFAAAIVGLVAVVVFIDRQSRPSPASAPKYKAEELASHPNPKTAADLAGKYISSNPGQFHGMVSIPPASNPHIQQSTLSCTLCKWSMPYLMPANDSDLGSAAATLTAHYNEAHKGWDGVEDGAGVFGVISETEEGK